MTPSRLAATAVRAAARLRGAHGIGPADAICPFDLADRLGLVVRLEPLPSAEGIYSPDPKPTIILTSERPLGRRRHSCAHEIGHHVFEHGLRIDQLGSAATPAWRPEEYLADRFAIALLMPKFAVESALARRKLSPSTLTAADAFVIAQDLGVGYTNLIAHLERTLHVLSGTRANQLRRAGARLSRLRTEIAGFQIAHDLILADAHWGIRPIDVEVGDTILLPHAIKPEVHCLAREDAPLPHLRAIAPGKGSIVLAHDHPPIQVRVSRRGYTGLARYRHLEDPDDAP